MRKNIQATAKIYALILAQLYTRQGITGRLTGAARGARYLTLSARLNNPFQGAKALELAEPLALASKTRAVIAARQEGVITYQFELQAGFWESYTRAELPTPAAVGLAEQRRPVIYDFEYPHSLIAGASGCGKTEAIKSALLAIMAQNTPDNIGILIADSNVELADFQNAVHLAAPIAVEPAAIDTMIALAHKELTTRRERNIKDGRRLLLVIDEVSDCLTPGNVAALRDLAKQGRKYRVNLMIGTQRAGQKELPAIMDNLLNRFIGQTDNAHTSALLTGQAKAGANRLTGKGDFLHIAGGNIARLQVAMATAADFNALERQAPPPLPDIEPAPVIELPEDAESATGGRPQTTIEPATLALYVYHRNALSIAQAKAAGISRYTHNYYKQFANEFLAELKRLRGQNG